MATVSGTHCKAACNGTKYDPVMCNLHDQKPSLYCLICILCQSTRGVLVSVWVFPAHWCDAWTVHKVECTLLPRPNCVHATNIPLSQQPRRVNKSLGVWGRAEPLMQMSSIKLQCKYNAGNQAHPSSNAINDLHVRIYMIWKSLTKVIYYCLSIVQGEGFGPARVAVVIYTQIYTQIWLLSFEIAIEEISNTVLKETVCVMMVWQSKRGYSAKVTYRWCEIDSEEPFA